MQKIATFIMSKKFIPIVLVLACAGVFIAFKSQGSNDGKNENPKSKFSKILKNVGILLEEGHYSPQKIDDAFSKVVLNRFETDLDDEKNIFLQTDIDSLKTFENAIDDEIHGAEIKSFYAVHEKYLKRLSEVNNIYTKVLSSPFDFTANETIQLDVEKLGFPKNETERQERWRKRMKFMVLGKYTDLLEQQKTSKGKKDYKFKADSTLEREAREYVKKTMDRFMTTKKTRETADENFSVFVNDIVGTMDPHSDYFAPVDLRSFNESIKGSFFGIGAQIREDDGKIKIGPLVTGMPAWRSGEVKENDEVIKIGQGKAEPIDVTGYSVSDAVKLIRGAEKGSEVRLTLKKIDGSTKVVSLIRDEIVLEETFAKSVIINKEHKIGYIYLPEFYADFSNPNGKRCAKDVAVEIEKLKKENVEGIVIDLRGNGGGSLYDVVQMAGLFIEDGPIVQVKSKGDAPNVLRDRDKSVQYTGPLAVLVDETSASASEIFAAAIQDYKRGIVIGSSSSYGKGTVQRSIPLNPEFENPMLNTNNKQDDLGSVKLTLQKFYRVNGGSTQMKGVTPDVVLPDRYDHLKFREKDNIYSLKWDEIEKATYKPWPSNSSMDVIINNANTATATNPNFNKIKSNVSWLAQNADKEFSLNKAKYEFDVNQQKSVLKEIDAAYKLSKLLNVKNMVSDSLEVNASKDKMKIERNKQFVKKIGEDIYIDAAVDILNKMIVNDNVVKIK
jgi:carboxyl-terminal processing protease